MPEIEALADEPDYNDIRSQWYSLRKQWQAIARDVEIDAELRARYDAAAQKLEAQEQEHRDAKGAAAGREPAAAAGAGAEVRDARRRRKPHAQAGRSADEGRKLAVGTMGPLPTKQDREDLMVRMQAVRTSLTPRIQELREAEEWKRWANVQVQEELCAKMEALVPLAETDPEKAVERNAHAAGAVEARRRRAALAGRGAVDALQDRAGAGLREVQGLLRAAGRRARREPEEEGSAVRRAPNRWPIPPTG